MRWPNDHPFILALSHDVDRVAKRWQFLFYFFRTIARRQPERFRLHSRSLGALLRGDDPYWNFERIIKLESDLGVRSTFFFLNEQGRASLFNPRSMVLFWGRYNPNEERIRQVIRKLDAGGWEVGLHGSFHSYRDEALLRGEKAKLEAILKKPVRGIRQHYLNLDIPHTWKIQARVGLIYDSRLRHSDQVGFGNTSLPFFPRDPSSGLEIPILQIPLTIMDGPLMRMEEPWAEALPLINLVEQEKGVLTINWHQRVFNPWEFQAYQDMYIRIVRECQRRGAWIAPLGAIADWLLNECRQEIANS